ncbi:MAG: oligosaccharide repeat unit polymerase, partial [Bacteroidetes bacterium]|nr:oligosaccharide repeat unit polymerase [Bacteroidota bacterium]
MIRVFSKIIKSWIKNNSLLSLYLVLSVFIIIGVIVDSGSIILHYLAIYYIAFLVFYFGFKTINKRLYNLSRWKYKLSIPEFPSSKNISYYIFGFIFISIVFHYIYIGFVPVIKAWQSFDYFDIVWIRRNITSESNTFWNYYSKFLLKAILPFSIVFLYIRKENKLLILAIILSFFYALSLMQKSYFVSLFIPILLYCFLNKKWIASFSFFAILVSGILLLVVVTNPNMRAKGENIKLIKQHPEAEYNLNYQPLKGSKSKIIAVTLTNRVFLIPGKM